MDAVNRLLVVQRRGQPARWQIMEWRRLQSSSARDQ